MLILINKFKTKLIKAIFDIISILKNFMTRLVRRAQIIAETALYKLTSTQSNHEKLNEINVLNTKARFVLAEL